MNVIPNEGWLVNPSAIIPCISVWANARKLLWLASIFAICFLCSPAQVTLL